MSEKKSTRNLRLTGLSKTSATVGAVVIIAALIAAVVGYNVYKKATTTTVTASPMSRQGTL